MGSPNVLLGDFFIIHKIYVFFACKNFLAGYLKYFIKK